MYVIRSLAFRACLLRVFYDLLLDCAPTSRFEYICTYFMYYFSGRSRPFTTNLRQISAVVLTPASMLFKLLYLCCFSFGKAVFYLFGFAVFHFLEIQCSIYLDLQCSIFLEKQCSLYLDLQYSIIWRAYTGLHASIASWQYALDCMPQIAIWQYEPATDHPNTTKPSNKQPNASGWFVYVF